MSGLYKPELSLRAAAELRATVYGPGWPTRHSTIPGTPGWVSDPGMKLAAADVLETYARWSGSPDDLDLLNAVMNHLAREVVGE